MKKILIAAAVVGAFAGTAQAQSSVTLYGIGDVGLRIDRTDNGTFRSLNNGDLGASRWGMRGSEDLGGGLKANFNFEQGINVDTGNNAGLATGFLRQSWVGLSGNWGAVRAGYSLSPHFLAWAAVETFGAGTVGSAGKPSVGFVGGQTRLSNAIFYDSPKMGGFLFRGAVQMGESTAAATKNVGNVYSLAATYANGPITVSYGHMNIKQDAGSKKDNTLGGKFNFGPATLHAVYWGQKSTTVNMAAYSVGVSAPVGAWLFRAQMARYNDKTAADRDLKSLGLGASYALSKRTTWYANYGRYDNNANSNTAISSGLQTGNVLLGGNPSSLVTGVRHTF